MMLVLVVQGFSEFVCVIHCFGYWALIEKVPHLGKNIGHLVHTQISGFCNGTMFTVRIFC